jgi:hypothetical protein
VATGLGDQPRTGLTVPGVVRRLVEHHAAEIARSKPATHDVIGSRGRPCGTLGNLPYAHVCQRQMQCLGGKAGDDLVDRQHSIPNTVAYYVVVHLGLPRPSM